jgi:hypothetical protein
MSGASRRDPAGHRVGPVGRLPFDSPAGIRVLVPGWPQFYWGQRERGWVLLGSFVVALGAGLLTWGTWEGWSLFGFAFLTHVTSLTDAVRQGSFPVYPRRTALVMITGALGVLFYLPALCALFITACPGYSPDRAGSGYLVNYWAYHADQPRRGHWVWLRTPALGQTHPARVVAVEGQEVEWTGHEWLVDGRDPHLDSPHRMTAWPLTCHFRVPEHQFLVEPEEDVASTPATGPLFLIAQDQIMGRAWARYYPVWDRRLL